jgi:hypothetical protein
VHLDALGRARGQLAPQPRELGGGLVGDQRGRLARADRHDVRLEVVAHDGAEALLQRGDVPERYQHLLAVRLACVEFNQ